MIEAGAGAWDPEETAPALAHLVAATAHHDVDIEEGSNSSGEEGSAAKKDGATTALRAASAMLLSGREDCRYAAANALADALIAPAASHPAADYARCLLPAAAAESSSRISCESVNRGSRVGGSLGRAAAAEPRPAPPGTELTQFTCDRCDKSPVLGVRWHCTRCPDFDLCDECHRESRSGGGSSGALYPSLHSASHPMICYRVGPRRVPGSGSAVAGSGADEAELAAASGGFGGLEGFGLRSGPPLRPTSEGKLRLAAALAATTDHGLPGGAAELSPYFVLLRRLVAVPEYAAAVAPAVVAAAEDAAAAAAAAAENGTAISTPENAREKEEKFLLRLSLLSAVLAAKARAPAGSPAGDIEPPRESLARNLLVVAEALTSSSSLSSHVEEPVVAVGGNGKTVSVRWGDPSASDRDASSELVREREIADAADEPGVAGCGALLRPDPAFGPVRFASESRLDLDAKLLENCVAVTHQLVRAPEAHSASVSSATKPSRRLGVSAHVPPPTTVPNGRGSETSPMVTLDAASSGSWTTTLAALLADPSRPKSAGIRRHARKLLLLVAKSRDAYHAARDAAALETHRRGFDTAALPRPGPRLAERSPHAAMLAAGAALSSCADIAAARPKSWRSFVGARPEFLRRVAKFTRWVPERAQLDALKLLTHAMSGSSEARAPGATLGLGSGAG